MVTELANTVLSDGAEEPRLAGRPFGRAASWTQLNSQCPDQDEIYYPAELKRYSLVLISLLPGKPGLKDCSPIVLLNNLCQPMPY